MFCAAAQVVEELLARQLVVSAGNVNVNDGERLIHPSLL